MKLKSNFTFGVVALACVSVIGATGCSKSKGGGAAPAAGVQQAQATVMGPYSYELTGDTEDGEPCTTGVHNFETKHQMCLTLQSEEINNKCAFFERYTKHETECADYPYMESLGCSVTLLQPTAELTDYSTFKESDVVKTTDFCVGETLDDKMVAGDVFVGTMHEDIQLNAILTYSPKEYTSAAKISLSRSAGGEDISIVKEFKYANSKTAEVGFTDDKKYQYVISCDLTWACDGHKGLK